MTCNITRPSAQARFDHYRNLFSSTMLNGHTVVPESNEWYAVGLQYAADEEFRALTEQAWKERDPRQACADNLVAMAAEDGVYPRAALPAQGYVKLTGTAGTTLPVPLAFTVAGKQYVTASNAQQPTAIATTGTAVVRIRAVVPGAVGNISATTGTMTTSVTNVNASVEVCGGTFCSGQDAETIEQFRLRYIARRKYQPRANMAWLKEKLGEWPCATRVVTRAGTCCSCGGNAEQPGLGSSDNCQDCGCLDCGGKMEFYLMFDNAFPNGIAPLSVVQEAERWLFGFPQGYGLGQVPIGVCGRIIEVKPVMVDVTVSIADCIDSASLVAVQNVVKEFFTTVEPSKPLVSSSLQAAVERVVDASPGSAEVFFTLVTPTDAYGPNHGPQGSASKVYVTGCSLEPDCDYMLAMRNLQINHVSNTSTGCS